MSKNPDETNAPVYRSYEDALKAITVMAKEHRLVFVIDEYPYLARSGCKFHYYIFSRGGFKKSLKELGQRGEVTLLTLEDIYHDDTRIVGAQSVE